MVRIARVFPYKTKFTPEDDDVFFRSPGLLEEGRYAEVHVSCVFRGIITCSQGRIALS